MNCYLMAAGNGMRLRPLTNDLQKCMLPVGGKPILEWWLDACFDSECFDDVFVNIHHMAPQVKGWLTIYSESKHRRIGIIDETEALLGTAGTIMKHGDRTKDFMIAYTDTFSMHFFCRLPRIMDDWQRLSRAVIAGLITFTPPGDNSTGNVTFDKDGVITSFMEKSTNKGVAWAGMMIARRGFYNFMQRGDRDMAVDVLPRLVGKMMAIDHVEAYDIGRGVECYEQFNRDFKKYSV